MTIEAIGVGDALSVAIHRKRGTFADVFGEIVNHTASLIRPMEVTGHSLADLLELHHTRHPHSGERIVSAQSLMAAQTPCRTAVTVEVRHQGEELKQLIFDHNCRTNLGGTWQSILMGGDTNANLGYENHSGAVTYTATTVTPTASPTWTTNQWKGHIVCCPNGVGATPTMVFGVVISNTATALTIDQWYAVGSATGASASTPANNSSFAILPGASPAYWLGMSADTTTEDIGDTTLASEFTGNFSTTGRWKGVYAQTTVPSGTGTSNSNSVFTIDPGVLTATGTITVARLALFNAQNGGWIIFDKKLGTAASLISGDTIDPKFTETLS